jgi:hypothetical protein
LTEMSMVSCAAVTVAIFIKVFGADIVVNGGTGPLEVREFSGAIEGTTSSKDAKILFSSEAMDQPGKRMNAGGTRSASQTPLALRRNACPASCIAPASTARTTGAPRRAPTRVAVSRSGDRWT